jgi:hypothetical protein
VLPLSDTNRSKIFNDGYCTASPSDLKFQIVQSVVAGAYGTLVAGLFARHGGCRCLTQNIIFRRLCYAFADCPVRAVCGRTLKVSSVEIINTRGSHGLAVRAER